MKRVLLALFLSVMAVCSFAQDKIKVVYHVNTGVETAAAILNNITNELNASPTDKIVVVTHGPGIDFLLSDAKDSKGASSAAR